MVQTSEGLTLADYWQILKKRKTVAILTFFLVVSSSYFFTRITIPVYQASATIELRYQTSHLLSLGGLPTMLRMINRDTEIRKIKSYPVISEVARTLDLINENSSEDEKNKAVGAIRSKISVKEIGDTTLIKISATDTDKDNTVKLTNTVANAYVKKTVEERNERTKKTRQFIEEQLNTVGKQLRDVEEKARKFKLTGKITERISDLGATLSSLTLQRSRLLTKYGEKHPDIVSLDKQIANLKYKMGNLTKEELEYLYLMREVTINEELYMMLNKKLKEALITEADKVIPVGIVDPAKKASLIKPDKQMNMLMGILGGFLLAIIGVLIQENLDTSLRTAHDIETYLKVPALAEIPYIKVEKNNLNIPHLLFQKKNSAYLESYNNLAASVISFSHNKKIQTVLFTSIMPREGKSEVITNFGIIKSQSGNKTLLIDADFRQPAINKFFKLPRKPGIIDIITEKLDFNHWIQPANSNSEIKKLLKNEGLFDLNNLYILPTGHLPPHPMRFLSSPEFKDIINRAKKDFDLILLDSPPIYYFADPAVLSGIVDAIVIVHKPGSIETKELSRAVKQLSDGDTNFLGIVLNGVKGKIRGKYYYRYYSSER